jgi:putative transposase
MTLGLVRYHESHQAHFITFCCYRKIRRFTQPHLRDLFLGRLEHTRKDYGLSVYGYVVMPSHVHLLLSETEKKLLSTAIQALKVSVSKLAKEECVHFWQKRYYDTNLHSHEKFIEKLRYIHRNPVRAKLVAKPEDWKWSSFREYFSNEVGPVEIDDGWTRVWQPDSD